MRFIEKNNAIYQFVNWITYRIVLLLSSVDKSKTLVVNNELHPTWVTGLFRSGTSITTQLLETLGMDLGPKDHLLKAKGDRASWNPKGFFENYLFMDWSLSAFEELEAWGHVPPLIEKTMKYTINDLDYKQFVYQSIVEIHDDRISNLNKIKVLRRYSPKLFNEYLKKEFRAPFAIKNPHFSVLFPILIKYWPKGKFLVVYRNPDASIESAQKIAPIIDYSLYVAYYKPLTEMEEAEVIYFSYDSLMENPVYSIECITKSFGLDESRSIQARNLIIPSLNRHNKARDQSKWPKELLELYNEMQKRAINIQ